MLWGRYCALADGQHPIKTKKAASPESASERSKRGFIAGPFGRAHIGNVIDLRGGHTRSASRMAATQRRADRGQRVEVSVRNGAQLAIRGLCEFTPMRLPTSVPANVLQQGVQSSDRR